MSDKPETFRLRIDAVGLSQSDAAAYALRLIGMMIQKAHTNGHSCGGVTGNASGRWEMLAAEAESIANEVAEARGETRS